MPMPDLGKQIGPLPLGAWIVVVGGGLGIAWYSRQSGGGKTTVVEDTSGDPGVGVGAGFYNASPVVVDNTPAGPVTNEEWARKAIDYLIAQGYDASAADTAVRKYLESSALSLAERALITIALTKLGSPPVPLPIPPPLPEVPKPVTQKPPPPKPAPQPAPIPPRPSIRLVRVTPWPTRTSTLYGIALQYYGNGNRWPELFSANRKGTTRPDGSPGYISNPNYLRPGDLVYVP